MATGHSFAAVGVVVVLLGWHTTACAQPSASASGVRALIISAEARLDSVSRRGDAAANAELFTEDAVVSLGSLNDIRGREAVRTGLLGFYERNTVQAHQLTLVELDVCGAIAHERGTYLFVAGARDKTPTTERGRYAAEWQRAPDGQWRIRRYLENLLPAEPAK